MKRMRAWLRLKMGWIPRPVRRAIVLVVGGTLLLIGVAGMILPIMPGVIFLPFGLAILALEFAWAARWLKQVRKSTRNVRDRLRGKSAESEPPSSEAHSTIVRPIPPHPPQHPNVAA